MTAVSKEPPLMSPSRARGGRLPTLRILDLLSTKVQAVRFDLVGDDHAHIARVGTVLLYAPLLLVGYLLLLAGVVKIVAGAWGWVASCLVFGLLHLAVASLGIWRGRTVGVARTFNVVDPAVATAQSTRKRTIEAAKTTTVSAPAAAARLTFPFHPSGSAIGQTSIGSPPGSRDGMATATSPARPT